MRVVVIGGSGHIGTYLVPRLVEGGHDVVNVARGKSRPYRSDPAWDAVRWVAADRRAEDAAGIFGRRVRNLKPDVVIDLIGFTPKSTRGLVEALQDRIAHFVHCGTIWVHGSKRLSPTEEDEQRRPFGQYGVRKAAVEAFLLGEAHRSGFPATILHPGHIVGPAGSRLIRLVISGCMSSIRSPAVRSSLYQIWEWKQSTTFMQTMLRRASLEPLCAALSLWGRASTLSHRELSRSAVMQKPWRRGSVRPRNSGSCRGTNGKPRSPLMKQRLPGTILRTAPAAASRKPGDSSGTLRAIRHLRRFMSPSTG